jgi:hypothetical protein
MWNTRGSKRLAAAGSDPQGRREVEDLEGKRWTYRLAECLKELDLPRSLFAFESRDPMKFLERAAGKLRPKTIRLRLRTFIRFQCWLGLANGVNFPTSIVQATDYVEERFGRTLPRTVPQSVPGSLAFMEDKGGIARQDRLFPDPSSLSTIRGMTKDLEKYSSLIVEAPPHLIVTMISLELYVCNVKHEAYPRAFAWLKLVKIWAALRTDEVA